MKIAIFTLGTRGDVQPFAVLGKALKERGHQVILSTAKNFESLVKSYGIEFIPVEADYQALLQSEEGKKLMKANPFAIKRNLENLIFPLVKQSLDEFYKLAEESDRVVYHVKTLADCFADQFPNKMIRAMVVPAIQPTTEFANPAFSGFYVPSFFNKLSFSLTGLGMKMFKKPIKHFRKSIGLSEKYILPETNFLYGISEAFLPKPQDYPKNSFFTGFWFDTTQDNLTPDLQDFINSGEPPLLITFGSMPFESKFDLQSAIVKLTQKFNERVIVVKGWGLKETTQLESHSSIKVIESAPYEKLFPHVRAVIHHGGIGTTAECLRAGKPFMICPILYPVGDQQFWGAIAFRKGVALRPIPISKMNEKEFLSSVYELLNNPSLYENANQIQTIINRENGLQKAINLIEKTIAKS